MLQAPKSLQLVVPDYKDFCVVGDFSEFGDSNDFNDFGELNDFKKMKLFERGSDVSCQMNFIWSLTRFPWQQI